MCKKRHTVINKTRGKTKNIYIVFNDFSRYAQTQSNAFLRVETRKDLNNVNNTTVFVRVRPVFKQSIRHFREHPNAMSVIV